MAFCVGCGNQLREGAAFCGKCGAPAATPVRAADETVARADRLVAQETLKKKHSKLVAGLAVAGTLLAIVINAILLVVADKLGGEAGGGFLILVGIAAAVLFAASLIPSKAERFNITNKKVIDPVTGAPLRMLWWFRWMTAMIALWTFVGSSDYFNKPQPAAFEAGAKPVVASTPADAPDASPPAKLVPLSDSELQYVSEIQSQSGTLGASMNRFQGLAARPEIFNDDWKLSLVKELAIWQIMYGEAQKLQPSARFSGVQECWVGALGELNGAASDIASGLDHSDVDKINAANSAVSRNTGRIAVCAQEMAALSANPGR